MGKSFLPLICLHKLHDGIKIFKQKVRHLSAWDHEDWYQNELKALKFNDLGAFLFGATTKINHLVSN